MEWTSAAAAGRACCSCSCLPAFLAVRALIAEGKRVVAWRQLQKKISKGDWRRWSRSEWGGGDFDRWVRRGDPEHSSCTPGQISCRYSSHSGAQPLWCCMGSTKAFLGWQPVQKLARGAPRAQARLLHHHACMETRVTKKKVRLYSSSLQLLFEQKMCKSESDRVAGKPGTPCDCAGCVKERGLMRSSPSVGQSSLSPFLSCFFFPVFSVVFSIHVL